MQDIPLNGPVVELSVHPTATARLVRKGKKDEEVYSCAGSEVELDLELKVGALAPASEFDTDMDHRALRRWLWKCKWAIRQYPSLASRTGGQS